MAARNFGHTLQTYQQLLDQYPARVVILPETAIPLFADQVPPGVLAWLADSARAGQQAGDRHARASIRKTQNAITTPCWR